MISAYETVSPGQSGDQAGHGFTALRKTLTNPVDLERTDSMPGVEPSFVPVRRRNTSVGSAGESNETSEEAFGRSPWKFMTTHKISFHSSTGVHVDPAKGAVVVVDPFSTGAILAGMFVEAGYSCIRVLSEWNSPVATLVAEGAGVAFDATVQHDSRDASEASYAATVAQLQRLPWPIVAIVPGCETGVLLADVLAAKMGKVCNGLELSQARRNKYLMGETVRRAGVRAVKQSTVSSSSHPDAVAFVREMEEEVGRSEGALKFQAIVKPEESAGSDDVFLCTSGEEVCEKISEIVGKVNGLGLTNNAVLLQEFLSGTEYVVDGCSRAGEYKTCAIWKYDKRAVNGANFVYFGMELVDASSPVAKALMAYTEKVCAALNIVEGPSHAEVMMTPTGPCLVEVGARCHGGEGTWVPIAMAAIGYTQNDLTFAAAVDPKKWATFPKVPPPPRTAGREVFLVGHASGTIRSVPGKPIIEALPAFHQLELAVSAGGFLRATIDCFTRPGSVRLIHEDAAVVEKDTARLRALEQNGLFDLGIICPEPPPVGAVVVVDPFTTGAVLAAKVVSRGYHLVMLFSDPSRPFDSTVVGSKAAITHQAPTSAAAAAAAASTPPSPPSTTLATTTPAAAAAAAVPTDAIGQAAAAAAAAANAATIAATAAAAASSAAAAAAAAAAAGPGAGAGVEALMAAANAAAAAATAAAAALSSAAPAAAAAAAAAPVVAAPAPAAEEGGGGRSPSPIRIKVADAALQNTLQQMAALPWPVVAVLAGAETGVPLCDQVSHAMHTRNNGVALTEARRNKYLMGEAVRKAGVRAVKQQRATEWGVVESFVNSELGGDSPELLCVVKPLESAGSDDVFKCKSLQEVRTAFDRINGRVNQLGTKNSGVLVQEFLSGIEYVVDGVSRDGVHKTVAIWRYDKRAVNGADFVYYGMELVDGESEEAQALIPYVDSVLDALNIMNGPSHAEVKLTPTGPCLVEIGSRCHGGEATWSVVANECIGYNQVDLDLDCYLNPDRFDAIPPVPRLIKAGAEVFLVSTVAGQLTGLPGLDTIRGLPSFRELQMHVQPGERLVKTVDCFCRPGSIRLVSDSQAQLEKDKEAIRALEATKLFDVVVA